MAPVGTKARMSMLSDRSSAARLKSSDQCTEEPPIKSAPPRPFDLAADDDELLAKRSGSRRPRLPGEQRRPGRCRTGSEGGRSRLRALTTSACSWQGADLAPRWPRHRRKTGSDSAHVRSIAPHTPEYPVGREDFEFERCAACLRSCTPLLHALTNYATPGRSSATRVAERIRKDFHSSERRQDVQRRMLRFSQITGVYPFHRTSRSCEAPKLTIGSRSVQRGLAFQTQSVSAPRPSAFARASRTAKLPQAAIRRGNSWLPSMSCTSPSWS